MVDLIMFKKFGFKSDETDYYFRYVLDLDTGFTHIIDFYRKVSGKHTMHSYWLEDTTTAGIDFRMLPCLWLKSLELRLKWGHKG